VISYLARCSRAALAVLMLGGLLVLPGCSSPRQGSAYSALLRQAPPSALPIPVDGVSAARLVNTWGAGRDGGRRHQGIDIIARRGTPIRSTTEGIIESKGMRGLGGLVVSVIGPGGYRHYYAHLEDVAAQAIGEWVHAGEIIGYVGNSGNAAVSTPHLHYGIYTPAGRAVNPYPFLRTGVPFQSLQLATTAP
jgi:murein DD-endopeptidase MepM/ murein hydrolase activator NlpD